MKKILRVSVLVVLVLALAVTAWVVEKERGKSIGELETVVEETVAQVQQLMRELAAKEEEIAAKDAVIRKYEPRFELGNRYYFDDSLTWEEFQGGKLTPQQAAGRARDGLFYQLEGFSVDGILRKGENGEYRVLPGPGDYHLEWPPQVIPTNFERPLDYVLPGPEEP